MLLVHRENKMTDKEKAFWERVRLKIIQSETRSR